MLRRSRCVPIFLEKHVVFQNVITAVLLWNHFSPSRLVHVHKCLQFIENMLFVVVVAVFFTLTDRASAVRSNIRG